MSEKFTSKNDVENIVVGISYGPQNCVFFREIVHSLDLFGKQKPQNLQYGAKEPLCATSDWSNTLSSPHWISLHPVGYKWTCQCAKERNQASGTWNSWGSYSSWTKQNWNDKSERERKKP